MPTNNPPKHHTSHAQYAAGCYRLFDRVLAAFEGKVLPGTTAPLLEQVLLHLFFDEDVREAGPPALVEYAQRVYVRLRMTQGGGFTGAHQFC